MTAATQVPIPVIILSAKVTVNITHAKNGSKWMIDQDQGRR
jgi:hypothetical protein